jgi:DNA-binding NarL/FixJ family response regulator
MPDMDGIETIQHIRKVRPDAKIIAISGGPRLKAEIPLDLASKFGAMCVLPKPFGPENLVQTVRNCLG